MPTVSHLDPAMAGHHGAVLALFLDDVPMQPLREEEPCSPIGQAAIASSAATAVMATAAGLRSRRGSMAVSAGGQQQRQAGPEGPGVGGGLGPEAAGGVLSPTSIIYSSNPANAAADGSTIPTPSKPPNTSASAPAAYSAATDPVRYVRWQVLLLLCIMQFGTEYCFDLPGSVGAGEGDTIQTYFTRGGAASEAAGRSAAALAMQPMGWSAVAHLLFSPAALASGDSDGLSINAQEEEVEDSEEGVFPAFALDATLPSLLLPSPNPNNTSNVINDDNGPFFAAQGSDDEEKWGSQEEPPSTFMSTTTAPTTTPYNNKMNQALYSFYSYPNIFMTILGGLLVDRYLGLRRTSVIVSGLVVASNIVFTFAVYSRRYWLMAVARLVLGCAGETLFVSQGSYMIRWFGGTPFQSLAFGIALSFARCGGGATYIVSPFVSRNFGGVIAALVAACVVSFLSFAGTITVSIIDRACEHTNKMPPSNIKINKEAAKRVEAKKRRKIEEVKLRTASMRRLIIAEEGNCANNAHLTMSPNTRGVEMFPSVNIHPMFPPPSLIEGEGGSGGGDESPPPPERKEGDVLAGLGIIPCVSSNAIDTLVTDPSTTASPSSPPASIVVAASAAGSAIVVSGATAEGAADADRSPSPRRVAEATTSGGGDVAVTTVAATTAADDEDGPPAFKLAYIRTLPPTLWFLAISGGLCYSAIFPFLGISKPYFESVYGMNQQQASTTAGLFHIVASGVCPVLGAIVDRTGRSPLWVMGSSIGNALLILCMMAYVEDGGFLSNSPRIMMFIMSIFYAMFVSSLWSFINLTVPPSATGFAYGIVTSVLNLTIATVPLITGTILDAYTAKPCVAGEAEDCSSSSASASAFGSDILPAPIGFRYALAVLGTVYLLAFFNSFVLWGVDKKYNKGLLMAPPVGREALKRQRDDELAALWAALEEAEAERKAEREGAV